MNIKNEENELYRRIEKYLSKFLKINKIDKHDLKQEDVNKFINSIHDFNNKISAYIYKSAMDKIFHDIDPSLNVDFEMLEAKVVLDKHFTKEEIIKICDYVCSINPQNAFIIYALWNGIRGEEYKDILGLKKDDIKDNFNTIYINNQKFECDEHMKKFIKLAIEQSEYYKDITSPNCRSTEIIEFNMNSEYIIKPTPTKRNNYGLDKMSKSSLQRRLIDLSMLCTSHFNTKIRLTGSILETSGIMHEMNKIEIEENILWKHKSIKEFLHSKNIKKNEGLIYSRYYTLYYNSENILLYDKKYLDIAKYLIENIKNNKLKSDDLYKKYNFLKDKFKDYINLLTIDCSINDIPLLPVVVIEPSDKDMLLDIFKNKIFEDENKITNSELEELYNQEYTRVKSFNHWDILIDSIKDKINNKAIENIKDEEVQFTEFENIEIIEGGKLDKYINQNKRNKRAREMKFKNFESLNGDLYCEVCKEDEKCVLEVHHDSIPICDMNEEHITKLSDLRILCANCHRKAHFYQLNVSELKRRNLK